MEQLFEGFYKNRKVLITGHTGFKGSWLSIWLKKLGAQVIGYSLEPPTQPNLFDVCNVVNGLISINGDIRNYASLERVLEEYKPEIIFHMAAQSLVRVSYTIPRETYETNLMGTINLFEAARKNSFVKVIVNVTSDKCYENFNLQKAYKETDPLGGYDPYSSSKACSEIVTQAYLRSFFNNKNTSKGITLASVRAGNVIGSGDWAEDRLVPDCIRAFSENCSVIIRYPEAVRSWQHILELLYGYLLLAQKLRENGSEFSGSWNFGSSDKEVKNVQWILERIAKQWSDNVSWKVTEKVQPYEADYLKLDCSKAKNKLGWVTILDLDIALNKTVEGYKTYYDKKNMQEVILNQINEYEFLRLKKG